MITYTIGRNLYGSLTGDTSVSNLSLGDTLINEGIREMITLKPWNFRDRSYSITTVAGTQFYNIPAGSVNDVTVTVGTTRYTPSQITDRMEWDRINLSTTVTSTQPQFCFIYNNQIGFWPMPSSSATVTVNYKIGQKDLSIADYTTGNISSIASGGTTVTGSGTAWTAQMAGRVIRITGTDTANTGDNTWYQIASVTSGTVLVLSSTYQGNSISGGLATYTIGQVSIIPEEFQILPVHRAVEHYYTFVKPDAIRAKSAKTLLAEGMKRMNFELGGQFV